MDLSTAQLIEIAEKVEELVNVEPIGGPVAYHSKRENLIRELRDMVR